MKMFDDAYDIIWDGVVAMQKQKLRCIDSMGRCAYHVGDKRCIVGSLISDADYVSGMEGLGPDELGQTGLLPERLELYVDVLEVMQNWHDTTSTFARMMELDACSAVQGILFDYHRGLLSEGECHV